MAQIGERRILHIRTDDLENLQDTQIGFETEGVLSYLHSELYPSTWGGKSSLTEGGPTSISRFTAFDSIVRFNKIYFEGTNPVIISNESYLGGATNKDEDPNSPTTRHAQSINIGLWSGKNNGNPSVNIGEAAGQNQSKFDFDTYYPVITPAPPGYLYSPTLPPGGLNSITSTMAGASVNVGAQAGWNSSSWQSTNVGPGAGSGTANAMMCVNVGVWAGYDNSASQTICIGSESGRNKDMYPRRLWKDPNNTSLGNYRLIEDYGVYIGWHSGIASREASRNTFVGSESGSNSMSIMYDVIGGDPNVVLYGGNNTIIGARAGMNGKYYGVSFLGSEAGGNSDAKETIAIGHTAGNGITFNYNNIAIGNAAMQGSTFIPFVGVTGFGPTDLVGSYNIAIGEDALVANQNGFGNIAIGMGAGYRTTGADNIIIGNFAHNQASNKPLDRSILIGYKAGYDNSDSPIADLTGDALSNLFHLRNATNTLLRGNFVEQRLEIEKVLNIRAVSNETDVANPQSGDMIFEGIVPKYYDGSVWQEFGAGVSGVAGALNQVILSDGVGGLKVQTGITTMNNNGVFNYPAGVTNTLLNGLTDQAIPHKAWVRSVAGNLYFPGTPYGMITYDTLGTELMEIDVHVEPLTSPSNSGNTIWAVTANDPGQSKGISLVNNTTSESYFTLEDVDSYWATRGDIYIDISRSNIISPNWMNLRWHGKKEYGKIGVDSYRLDGSSERPRMMIYAPERLAIKSDKNIENYFSGDSFSIFSGPETTNPEDTGNTYSEIFRILDTGEAYLNEDLIGSPSDRIITNNNYGNLLAISGMGDYSSTELDPNPYYVLGKNGTTGDWARVQPGYIVRYEYMDMSHLSALNDLAMIMNASDKDIFSDGDGGSIEIRWFNAGGENETFSVQGTQINVGEEISNGTWTCQNGTDAYVYPQLNIYNDFLLRGQSIYDNSHIYFTHLSNKSGGAITITIDYGLTVHYETKDSNIILNFVGEPGFGGGVQEFWSGPRYDQLINDIVIPGSAGAIPKYDAGGDRLRASGVTLSESFPGVAYFESDFLRWTSNGGIQLYSGSGGIQLQSPDTLTMNVGGGAPAIAISSDGVVQTPKTANPALITQSAQVTTKAYLDANYKKTSFYSESVGSAQSGSIYAFSVGGLQNNVGDTVTVTVSEELGFNIGVVLKYVPIIAYIQNDGDLSVRCDFSGITVPDGSTIYFNVIHNS